MCGITKKVPSKSSEDNAVYFSTPIANYACNTDGFRKLLQAYKYVKFNNFKFYVTADVITYDVANVIVKNEPSLLGVHQFLRNQGCYFLWNADTRLADGDRQAPEKIYDNPHRRKCAIGHRKPATFVWKVPEVLRRYFASTVVSSSLGTPKLNDFFELVSGMKDFRIPSNLIGTCQQTVMELPIFLKQNNPEDAVKAGVSIIYKMNCYCNATFRSRQYV